MHLESEPFKNASLAFGNTAHASGDSELVKTLILRRSIAAPSPTNIHGPLRRPWTLSKSSVRKVARRCQAIRRASDTLDRDHDSLHSNSYIVEDLKSFSNDCSCVTNTHTHTHTLSELRPLCANRLNANSGENTITAMKETSNP